MLSTKVALRSWVSHISRHRSSDICLRYARPRTFSTDVVSRPSTSNLGQAKVEGLFFLASIFPIRLGSWDLRYCIALFQEEALITKVMHVFNGVDVHGFEVNNVEPRIKDGGIFIHFRYKPTSSANPPKSALDPPDPALVEIEETLQKKIAANGGLPTWLGLNRGTLWRVRGRPWKEDMQRFASPVLRVAFEGPDVTDECMWDILRPYGRIRDLTSPTPVPAGSLRSATITFERLTSATISHNCIYGAFVPPSAIGSETLTRLSTSFERPLKAHVVRDWLALHPRIVLPIAVFLLGTLTYTVFDPIRAVCVEAKVMGWLDYRKYAVIKWLRRNTLDMLHRGTTSSPDEELAVVSPSVVWKDRQEAAASVQNYLTDHPSTIMFLHGPAGSGKTRLLRFVLETSNRRAMVIDCAHIYAGSSDRAVMRTLAEQTGYWPIFTFLNSVYQIVDLASVGLIGQKAGLSTSLETQVSQVLDVVAQGLRRVSIANRREAERRRHRAQEDERKAMLYAERKEQIRRGLWHDGRIDFVAGNIFSELGIGIERFGPADESPLRGQNDAIPAQPDLDDKMWKEREYRNAQDVGSLPVVVIKNFSSKSGKEAISGVLADWAAGLISSQVAYVVVISENREDAKRLAKAIPTKPLGIVALTDADPSSSLSYINQKLKERGMVYDFSTRDKVLIERLGGRVTDIESIIHKVHAGQSVEDAVDDLIQRGVAEMRKNAFGDDAEDAKGLPWTKQQAWTVLKLLAQKDELPYQYTLSEFPFKGDEGALKAMERAEIISITTVDGRPSMIRPGKPIHRYVFQRLVADKVFRATQDIAYNELLISGADSTIKSAETELSTLKDVISGSWTAGSWKNKVNSRVRYLTTKLQDALKKVERLEEENTRLKQVLAQGDDAAEVEGPKQKGWWAW